MRLDPVRFGGGHLFSIPPPLTSHQVFAVVATAITG
jgi:hypothetical protein